MMLAKITLDSSARNAPSGLVPGLRRFETQSGDCIATNWMY
jgi:hypothetical protein